MESYFDLSIVTDFSDCWSRDELYDKIYDLGITNIYDNTRLGECYDQFVADILFEYRKRIINPMCYLRPGMNARIVWELHKSAVIAKFMDLSKYGWFYEGHTTNMGVQEIKEWRAKLLSTKFVSYEDHDWQYYWVLATAFPDREECDNLLIDAEMYFADRDLNKPDDLGDPRADLAWRLLPVPWYKPKINV